MFTDITYGVHDRDRIIVARETDGTLREVRILLSSFDHSTYGLDQTRPPGRRETA